MQVFLSYAAENRRVAEEIELALSGAGHEVFFDRASLTPGGEFRARIKEAIGRCDAFVFLVSPHSVAQGSYARTELKYARDRWPNPAGRVLPVMALATDYGVIPAYLTQVVTVLEPEGNVAAEVVDALDALRPPVQHAPPPIAGGANTATEAQVVLGAPTYVHNVPAAAPQGAMPGMQISVPVTVTGAQGRSIQIVVRFNQFGGPPLFANPAEMVYRDATGNVATGTRQRPVAQAQESYVETAITIPYYALNFMPTGGMSVYQVTMVAQAYVDQRPVAQSVSVPFSLRF